MKSYQFSVSALTLIALLIVTSGCEYDGPTSMYNNTKDEQTVAPKITQLNPANEAGPGVNYITIMGNNFVADEGRNKVYFDNYETEIISASADAIKVRRPAIISK